MPSNYSGDSRISITIDGHTHKDWTRYSIDSDLFTPADAWQMGLGIPAGKLPGYVRPWAAVEVREGDTLILTGRVDALRRRFYACHTPKILSALRAAEDFLRGNLGIYMG